ncbi:hypothetical protein BDB01DRAFT_194025 [Pilobolus umbonatus]|nr:hypothetical protein BDB01DRAFT_194025 [Pilobolus umbonatus]
MDTLNQIKQRMNETELVMGNRPSRQRRHLPIAATSSTHQKKSTHHKHIPLIKMTYDSPHETVAEDIDMASTSAYEIPNKEHMNQRKARKNRYTNDVKNRYAIEMKNRYTDRYANWKKYLLRIIGFSWVIFVIIRVYYSLQNEDYSNLSLFHFIVNWIQCK